MCPDIALASCMVPWRIRDALPRRRQHPHMRDLSDRLQREDTPTTLAAFRQRADRGRLGLNATSSELLGPAGPTAETVSTTA